MRLTVVKHGLEDCRAAHRRIYAVESYENGKWTPYKDLVVTSEGVTIGGEQVDAIEYQGANHALVLRGKQSDATFSARIDLTECGSGFVGSMSLGTSRPVSIRGAAIEAVYHTERQPQTDPKAPYVKWDDFTIRTEWRDDELKVTYLLGQTDVSDRVRVTKVDRPKGETTLEMAPQLDPPFLQNQFVIVLTTASHSFAGTYTSEDGKVYNWRGGLSPKLAAARAAPLAAAAAPRRVVRAAAAVDNKKLQELDNISSIQIVIGPDNKQVTVDYAQTTCGDYFNKCLVNGLDQKWIDGIYGHRYLLPEGVQKVFDDKKAYFQANAVLGTGQMLYDNLGTNERYKDLIKRVLPEKLRSSWEEMGKTKTEGPSYEEVSNALYIQGYRDGVAAMDPFLKDNPEKWAEDYFNWLSEPDRIQTWQIQVASKMFDNVRQRMYEWYVKLQVLAPNKDYGQRFLTIAYAALLGVNYSKSQWSEDLRPFLEATLKNARDGKTDPSIMNDAERHVAEEIQEQIRQLIQIEDQIHSLVLGIADAITVYQNRKGARPLTQLASDGEFQRLVGDQLQGEQYKAWSELSGKGKAGGVLMTMFYGATAGFLIYTIATNASKPLTPKQIVEEISMGMLAMAITVKGAQKMMSLGVGRFLENFARGGEGGAFRTFAGDIATWFKEGGKIIPEGKIGKAFVAIFGESAAEFMARRIGPAMAIVGVVLSAFILADAIKSGNVKDIVFEALNTFFALADLVFIGLELLSVSWAGPVGLAIAAIGIIILLVQFIWGLIDPPVPPPDPITEFVNGPMVNKGFAKQA
jgi:hypothetical protein